MPPSRAGDQVNPPRQRCLRQAESVIEEQDGECLLLLNAEDEVCAIEDDFALFLWQLLKPPGCSVEELVLSAVAHVTDSGVTLDEVQTDVMAFVNGLLQLGLIEETPT